MSRNSSLSKPNFEGACTCGAIRNQMSSVPLFVHCWHYTCCQRDSDSTAGLTSANLNGRHAGRGGNGQRD